MNFKKFVYILVLISVVFLTGCSTACGPAQAEKPVNIATPTPTPNTPTPTPTPKTEAEKKQDQISDAKEEWQEITVTNEEEEFRNKVRMGTVPPCQQDEKYEKIASFYDGFSANGQYNLITPSDMGVEDNLIMQRYQDSAKQFLATLQDGVSDKVDLLDCSGGEGSKEYYSRKQIVEEIERLVVKPRLKDQKLLDENQIRGLYKTAFQRDIADAKAGKIKSITPETMIKEAKEEFGFSEADLMISSGNSNSADPGPSPKVPPANTNSNVNSNK